ncbi:sulfotransferase family 2 domain-containing protein [Kiritimatiellota bacterium B12222]|nr:sulfotransferase family 2 domain-containing protein [Kiritimatiellota bacterium B12222]
MPIYTKNANSILFIHIPKTGGSSLEKMVIGEGWSEHFCVRGKSLRDIPYYKTTPQHLHSEGLSQFFNFEEFNHVITIVRDPFSRLKSEYYWQQSRKLSRLGVEEWIDQTFSLYKENPYIYDNHIRPQVEFIPDIKNICIFKIEENGVQKALELFQSYRINASNFSKWWLKVSRQLFHSKYEKQSIRNPETDHKFLSFHEQILNFYQSDYTAFDYSTLPPVGAL